MRATDRAGTVVVRLLLELDDLYECSSALHIHTSRDSTYPEQSLPGAGDTLVATLDKALVRLERLAGLALTVGGPLAGI